MKIIPRKRRIQGKTNYTKRRRLLEARKPRIAIRKSNKYITIQYIESKLAQDSIKVGVNSKELLEYGWPKEKSGSLKSITAAYLAGLLFGKKISKLPPAIVDTGLIISTKGSKVYAALKGIVDSGYKISHNTEVFPDEKSIKSKDFFEKVKSNITK